MKLRFEHAERVLLLVTSYVVLAFTSTVAVADNMCVSAVSSRDRAIEYYELGDLTSAIERLREAIKLCPAEPFYKFMLANALYRTGNLNESGNAYRDFVEVRPHHFEAHMSLGFTLFEMGEVADAVQQWTTAVQIEPNSPFAHAALAAGLYALQDLKNAHFHYDCAVTLDSRYSDANDLAIDIRWKQQVRALLSDASHLTQPIGDR